MHLWFSAKRSKITMAHWKCPMRTRHKLRPRTKHINLKHHINKKDQLESTPLHTACFRDEDDLVQTLLQHPNINVNIRNCFNETPLYIAVKAQSLNVFRKLMNHPFILINETNNFGTTPLEFTNHNIRGLHGGSNSDDIVVAERLQSYIEMKTLLEEFLLKRRFQSYQYFLSTLEDL